MSRQRIQSVETPGGNVAIQCRADLPYDLDSPMRALRINGEECQTPLGTTTDTTKVFTPAGKVHLTCRINGTSRQTATGWVAGLSVVAVDPLRDKMLVLSTTTSSQSWSLSCCRCSVRIPVHFQKKEAIDIRHDSARQPRTLNG